MSETSIPSDVEAFLAEVEARESKATPGPWEECGSERGGCQCGLIFGPDCPVVEAFAEDENAGSFFTVAQKHHNAEFIAHARTDLPMALAIIRKQAAERDELRERLAKLESAARDALNLLGPEYFDDGKPLAELGRLVNIKGDQTTERNDNE